MQTLGPMLLFDYNSPTQTDEVFHVQALARVYIPTASDSATKSYISELQAIVQLSKMS